jgi:acetoacetate decarboxylase
VPQSGYCCRACQKDAGAVDQASPGASFGQVRDQLDRRLSSAEFAGPARLRRFLQYVVEEKLAGRGAKLEIMFANHIITDLTLGLGKMVHGHHLI